MDVDLEDESVYRERERAQLEKLVHPDIQNDVGCSQTGQYELIGASCSSFASPRHLLMQPQRS